MTYDELVSAIEFYGKRQTNREEVENIYIPLMLSRVGRSLKVDENWIQDELELTDNPTTLTYRIGAIDSVEFKGPGGYYELSSGTRQQLNTLLTAAPGGDPRRHLIRGSSVEIAPFKAGTLRLAAYVEPVIQGASADGTLDRWPQVFLYGALVELHISFKNWNDAEGAAVVFNREVRECNRTTSHRRTAKRTASR